MTCKVFDRVYTRENNHELVFENDQGRYIFFHRQDCCESVWIEEIVGDLEDLVGHPLFLAEEVSGYIGPTIDTVESYTYTFYKFGTPLGRVTVRWLGESNGYYSESVDLVYEPKVNGIYLTDSDDIIEWQNKLLEDEP